MTVVSAAHLNLVRARREMEKAFQRQDWDGVKDCDQLLSVQLNHAFDDDTRDSRSLVNELERVLSLYATIVHALPQATAEQWLKPESIN